MDVDCDSSTDLENVLEISGSELLHLRRIVSKMTNGIEAK